MTPSFVGVWACAEERTEQTWWMTQRPVFLAHPVV